MRTSWLVKLRWGVAAVLVALLVLLAVSMSLLRLAVAYAPQLRGQVEQVLAQALERPLTLGGLRATWAGRHPRLILEDVRLTGGSLAGLEVAELKVDIDLLRSLRTMRLHLAQVEAARLDVHAAYADDGSLRLTRIGNADISAAALEEGGGPRRLPAQVRLRDARVQIVDLPADTTYRFGDVELELASVGQGYALGGYIPLPGVLGQSIRFRAEWQGGLGSPAPFTGQLYVDARRLRLQPLSSLLQRLGPVPAVQGSAHVEFWADLTPRGLAQASGRLTLLDIALQDEAQAWRTVAGQLKGVFHWQQQEQGWDLAVADLSVASAYRVWPPTELALRLRRQAGSHTLELASEYLHLGDFVTAAGMLPLVPEPLRQWLLAAQPTGELLQPQLVLRWGEQGLEDFDAHAVFRAAGLRPYGRVPGAKGLAGSLRIDRRGGRVVLNAGRGELEFAAVFREPLPFDQLQGEAFWRVDDHGWQVSAPLIEVANEDGRAKARLLLLGGEGGAPFMDLRAQVTDAYSTHLSRYLPVPVLPPSVLSWLDRAGIRSKVPQADLILYGRLDEFPYTRNNGLFLVQADFADLSLDYHAGWPPVEAATGQLRFLGNSMAIRVDSGRIHGATIESAVARIDRLGGEPLLIDGQVRGSGQQYLAFLQAMPVVGDGLREQLAAMELTGSHPLEISLNIPLKPGARVQLQGSVTLEGADYRLPKWDLALDQLQGVVQFDERGVTAQQVVGFYRNVPVTLSAETIRQSERERIRLSGHLRAPPAVLLRDAPPPIIKGETSWQVRLLLPGFQSPPPAAGPLLELQIVSELQGITVALPPPLGKAAADRRPLRISVPIGESGVGAVSVRYGDELRALLGLARDGFEVTRAAVQLGAGRPTLPRQGVVIRGALDVLDLQGWSMPAWSGQGAAAPRLKLQDVDVRLGQLRVWGQQFRDAAIRAQAIDTGWTIALDGPDMRGFVVLPADRGQPILAQLERLRLQVPAFDGQPKQAASRTAELPILDVTVAELALGEQTLGQLTLQTRQADDGVAIEQLRIDGPFFELQANGSWNRASGRSRLQASLGSSNAGRLLDALGYRNAMRGGRLRGGMNVSWEGRLLDFSLPALSGNLDLSLRDGQILAVEPGAGRLFGLLSIADLPRRLSLDFSDLFGKGFSYDKLEIHLLLADGDAHTREFYMQGPAAKVELKGRIGLAARDYDQRITVTPNVSTALPAIGAVAGGPIGAVAGFVTQKLLEDEINKLSRYRYRVAGSWDAPKIEPVATQDNDGREQAEAGEEVTTP